MFSTSIAAIAGFAALTMAVAPDLSGSGHIIVLDGTNGITNNQTIADKIGCINADGFLTLNDCAVFSSVKSNPMTNAGVSCNFQDESQPLNVDSKYGEQDHAYQCYKGAESEPWPFYSIDGFNQPYMCYGDIDCLYDVNRAPEAGEKLPVWEYRWGSQQLGITPGHLAALFLWVKI